MDPPWFAGLNLKYPVLRDKDILRIPFETLQTSGYLMVWILDMKEKKIRDQIEKRGYIHKATVTWGKLTKNNNLVSGSGVTVRHNTEKLYIFAKGNVKEISTYHRMQDLVMAQVRGESIKPEQIYTEIYKLVPQGYFLEIFARSNNIRPNYVSVGNMLRP